MYGTYDTVVTRLYPKVYDRKTAWQPQHRRCYCCCYPATRIFQCFRWVDGFQIDTTCEWPACIYTQIDTTVVYRRIENSSFSFPTIALSIRLKDPLYSIISIARVMHYCCTVFSTTSLHPTRLTWWGWYGFGRRKGAIPVASISQPRQPLSYDARVARLAAPFP